MYLDLSMMQGLDFYLTEVLGSHWNLGVLQVGLLERATGWI
jgi:hypothetical protein